MSRFQRILWAAFALLLLNSAYLAAFAQANIFYMANVLLHIAAGTLVVAAVVWILRRENPVAAALLATTLCIGVALAIVGNTSDKVWVLAAHIAIAVLGVAWISKQHRVAVACLAMLPLATYFYDRNYYQPTQRISNRTIMIPTSMKEE
ncbi:MAG: hypothetical protein NTW74_09470, partial [Acidobacteria bacterium]|nr:hypothetical protein [Acidobacteriota bacterium]